MNHHWNFVFLFFFAFPMVILSPSLSASDSSESGLPKLIQNFADPANKERGEELFGQIREKIEELVNRKNFRGARFFVEQLEIARIGRTPSLYRSLDRQRLDKQILKIWKLRADLYQSWGNDQMEKDNREEAAQLFKESKKVWEKWNSAFKAQKNANKEFQIFEEEKPPLVETKVSPIIPFPTALFLFIPEFSCLHLPQFAPFEVLQSGPLHCQVALSQNWNWTIKTFDGSFQSLIIGSSFQGQTIIWIAGPFSGNRPVSCKFSNGRWILSP